MDLSIVHCRTASIRGGLLAMLKRAWSSRNFRKNTRRSSKAETRKCPISTSRASRAGGAGLLPEDVDQADRRLDWREVIHARSRVKAVPRTRDLAS